MKRILSAVTVMIAIITVCGAGGCGRTPYARAVNSTVWIEAGAGQGTGVFVGDGRYVLTAYHVVANQPIIRAHPPEREAGVVVSSPARYKRGMRAVVVAANPGKDLALLRCEGRGEPMPLSRAKPTPGDALFAIGCDEAALFGYSAGHLRQSYRVEVPVPRGTFAASVLEMSVPVNFGNSGGPVVDARGELAGIISHVDFSKNQSYLAIAASEIRPFLAQAMR